MESILKNLESLNNEDWDYYKKEEHTKINIEDLSCQKNHIEFIKNYLTVSDKIGILDNFNFAIDNFERAIHTNSVFFLGCLLYKKLKLKNKIKFYRSDQKDEFSFIWFLTSLVHDFGYEVEKDKDKYPDITNKINSIEITHNLFDYNSTSNKYLKLAYDRYKTNTKTLLDNISVYYTKRFNGRNGNKGKIDHGIYSGLKLFDSLVKNRSEREDQKNNETKKLYWGKELEEFYAIASFSIAMHNIRRDELIEKHKELKFSIDKEPFIFLFGLADTIEPTKTFDCCNTKYVVENILIDFKDARTIIIKNKEGSKLDFSKMQKKAKGLESWLNLEVILPSSEEIIINIVEDFINATK